MNVIERFINTIANNKFLFFFLWLAIISLYLPAYKAGFYSDFYDTLKHYQDAEFIDFLNREGFKNQSLYQITQLLLYILIFVFGFHPIPWFLLFTALHVLTGFLIFRFFSTYLKMIGWEKAKTIALVGVILFLISPIAAEVVIWKASFHYYIAISIIFLILNWLLTYLKTEQRKYIWFIGILYFLSSYMLELFYLTPAFVFLVIFALKFSKKISYLLFRKSLLNIFLPLSLIWCLHLITYYFIYGKWIAHYEFNLGHAFTLGNAISQLFMYFIHILSMESFLPMDQRLKIYNFTKMPWVVIVNAILLFGTIIWGVWKYRLMNVKAQFLFLIFILCLTSCILVIPMWFNTVTMITNDRYYYLPSVFLFLFFSIIILKGSKYKAIRYLVMGLYMTTSLFATFSIVMTYRASAKIQFGLLDNYKWQDADTVLFLNLPNNYNGVFLFPADTLDVFNSHLSVFGYDTIKGKAYDVSSYNMQNPWDGAHVIVKDSLRLEVTPNQYGCWWWYRTLGAYDYENDFYTFTLINNGFSYLLDFKKKPSNNTVILIQNGDQWREIDMSKINEEQW